MVCWTDSFFSCSILVGLFMHQQFQVRFRMFVSFLCVPLGFEFLLPIAVLACLRRRPF